MSVVTVQSNAASECVTVPSDCMSSESMHLQKKRWDKCNEQESFRHDT